MRILTCGKTGEKGKKTVNELQRQSKKLSARNQVTSGQSVNQYIIKLGNSGRQIKTERKEKNEEGKQRSMNTNSPRKITRDQEMKQHPTN